MWNSNVARKMGKSSGEQWTILSVSYFLLIFENKTLLFMKNQRELIQGPYKHYNVSLYSAICSKKEVFKKNSHKIFLNF